ncbi:MAG: hypothetical protein JXA21_06520 [Anaerolineae bacterium]|nr:hypothetical protein [Anaerolineae bacterium]
MRNKTLFVSLLLAVVLLGCRTEVITETELTVEQVQLIEPHLVANVGVAAFGGVVFCPYQAMSVEQTTSTTTVAYLWVLCQEYYQGPSGLEKGSGVSLPVALTLQRSESGVVVSKHQVPGDGALYEKDVKMIFPQRVWPQIFATGEEGTHAYNARAMALEAEAEGKALAHFASAPVPAP